jgi:arylsulfatase A-like enzyme
MRGENGLPDILLILLDATRADHLSCYGYRRKTTPNLDRIAAEGVLYENAISASCWTLESLASILTGKFPSEHGTHWGNLVLDGRYETLPEAMRRAGYRTACLSNNVSFLHRGTGLDRGFEVFREMGYPFGTGAETSRLKGMLERLYRAFFFTRHKFDAYQKRIEDRTAFMRFLKRIYAKTLYGRFHLGAWETNRWIKHYLRKRGRESKPLFLMGMYIDPHLPYHPPRRLARRFMNGRYSVERLRQVNQDAAAVFSGRIRMKKEDFEFISALYDAELAYVDEKIGQVLEYLRRRGRLDSTMIVISADHGEALGEQGMMDHRYSLHDALIRVPLIIRYPKLFPSGTRAPAQVQTTDILPTLKAVAGGTPSDAPLIRAIREYDDRPAFSEYLVPQPLPEEEIAAGGSLGERNVGLKAIRSDGFKLVLRSDGHRALYDLARDPEEVHDVSSRHLSRADALEEKLRENVGVFGQAAASCAGADREDIKGRLKELGYL